MEVQVRIDPKLIIDFATIAEEGSFTRAAEKLRVAQPWLSARLSKLEGLLGFRLFDRTTRSVALTDRGKQFLEAARGLANASANADRLAFQLARKTGRRLRVGAAPYTKIIRDRSHLISSFAQAHPEDSLELETGWSLSLLGRLDSGAIDLTFLMGEVKGPGYDKILLRQYGIALTLSRDHPLASAAEIYPESVKDTPIQVFTRSLYPDLWDVMHAPLVEVGARFIEVPDMAEGAPNQMDSPDAVAAFFDFGEDDPGAQRVVRIPLAANVAIPFHLLRRSSANVPAGEEFWELALKMVSARME